MTRTAIVLAVLTLVSGCAAQAVPGGGNHLTWQAMPDGTAKVSFFGNKDTSVRNLKADMKTGQISIDSMDANGSALGLQQMQWSIVESNNRRAVIGDLIGLVQTLAPILGAAGGGSVPSIGGGAAVPVTTLDTPAQMAQRNAILAKIANCPFLAAAPDQQALYAGIVAKAPASQLAVFDGIIARLTALPATVTP